MSISPSYVDGLELRIKELGEQVAALAVRLVDKEIDVKATPKSCSCWHCIHGKRTNPGKLKLKLAERAFRHRAKQDLAQGKEDIAAAPKTDRIS